jgi:hypothetical protein
VFHEARKNRCSFSGDFWVRILARIRIRQGLLHYAAVLSGIARAIPHEADRIAEQAV